MSRYMFHVRHNARPDTLQEYLYLVSENGGASDEQLLERGAVEGLYVGTTIGSVRNLRENVTPYLRDFQLLEAEKNHFTDIGQHFYQLTEQKPALFAELMHFYFCITWHPARPREHCFSWSYAATVRFLWRAGQLSVTHRQLANDVQTLIEVHFPDADAKSKLSFGERSIRGIVNWLEALEPPVIRRDGGDVHFARRAFCPPELLVLAVNHIYERQSIPYESNLLLEPDTQEAICQLCLLEPESLERVAEYAVMQFHFLSSGMSGGWGSYLRLARAPHLEDL